MHRRIHLYILILLISGVFLNALMLDQELYDPIRTVKRLFSMQSLPVLVLLIMPVLIGQMKQRWEWLFFNLLVFSAWMMYVGRQGGIWNSLHWVCWISFFWIAKSLITLDKNNNFKWFPLQIPILTESYNQQAGDMEPHKFYPKYLLAMMYDANPGIYQEKAQIIAQDILTSEVKVMPGTCRSADAQSTVVEEIQQAMRDILSKSIVENTGDKLEQREEHANSKPLRSGVPFNKGKAVQR